MAVLRNGDSVMCDALAEAEEKAAYRAFSNVN